MEAIALMGRMVCAGAWLSLMLGYTALFWLPALLLVWFA